MANNKNRLSVSYEHLTQTDLTIFWKKIWQHIIIKKAFAVRFANTTGRLDHTGP